MPIMYDQYRANAMSKTAKIDIDIEGKKRSVKPYSNIEINSIFFQIIT